MITLADLVHQHVARLRRVRGNEWRGLCPFHGDTHTPNFYFNEQKQIWYCFACGEGGGVVRFVARLRRTTEQDARRWLRENHGTDYRPAAPARRKKLKCEKLEELERRLTVELRAVNRLLDRMPTAALYTHRQVLEVMLDELDEQINYYRYIERRRR